MGALNGGVSTALVLEADTTARLADLAEQLEASTETIEFLEESLADVELAREDIGWTRIGSWAGQQLSRDGLNRSAKLCRAMATVNPLIKRGLGLRHAYTWGNGVEIEARDKMVTELTDLVQEFARVNRDVLFGSQAQEELERVFGTDGNIFLAHFTKPRTGKVKVRSLPFIEITERVPNPEDRDEPWFYKREWTTQDITAEGRRTEKTNKAYYPDIRYRPASRPKQLDGVDIVWDAPILHACVNRQDGDDFGVGDAFAAIDFARAYTSFLDSWAKLMKALAKYAWQVTGETAKKAGAAATEVRKNNATTADRAAVKSEAGATAVMAGAKLEAIPKSGATLDANSGRPLAAMVASAIGVPVTMLLADPGITGARATAQTLDKPTELEFKSRQRLWQRILGDSIDYAINQSIKAPSGPLTGTIVRDEWGDEIYTLTGDAERGVKVTFPELDDIDPKAQLDAIAVADGLDKIPDEVIIRAALMALPGVEDIDKIMDTLTDDQGNFVPPSVAAGDRAVKAFRDGENPAEVL